jgi:poly-beta-1,6-N-acetyl-D-glucosamine N-deacetylase
MKAGLPGRIFWMFVFLALAVFPSLSAAADHIVILQYHHFGSDTPPSTSISLEQFDQHLDYLESNTYTVWPLEKALLVLKSGKTIPEKCVAITIDDAYISVFTGAFSRLKQKNWPFTVFVATRDIDRGGSIFMTWSQMLEMKKSGATFAAHSHTHPYMIRKKSIESEGQWKERMLKEIRVSRQRLRDELGENSLLFAYPYGEYNLPLKKIIRELGMIGIAQNSGAVWKGSDFEALPRFPMSGVFADMRSFKIKVNSLPLPVIKASPQNPILPAYHDKPILSLQLEPGDYRIDSLTCFASGQGQIRLRWIDKKNREFEVFPDQPVPKGRSRYNCTAAQNNSNRYYWYSHQWIRETN